MDQDPGILRGVIRRDHSDLLRQQNVFRLQVPEREPGGVDRGQRGGHLPERKPSALLAEGSAARERSLRGRRGGHVSVYVPALNTVRAETSFRGRQLRCWRAP